MVKAGRIPRWPLRFQKEGDRWYGKTKEGQWRSEQDALAAGFREAKR